MRVKITLLEDLFFSSLPSEHWKKGMVATGEIYRRHINHILFIPDFFDERGYWIDLDSIKLEELSENDKEVIIKY